MNLNLNIAIQFSLLCFVLLSCILMIQLSIFFAKIKKDLKKIVKNSTEISTNTNEVSMAITQISDQVLEIMFFFNIFKKFKKKRK